MTRLTINEKFDFGNYDGAPHPPTNVEPFLLKTLPSDRRWVVRIAHIQPRRCSRIKAIYLGDLIIPIRFHDPYMHFVIEPGQTIMVKADPRDGEHSFSLLGYSELDV